MPHLVLLYTANLDPAIDISGLCRSLADTMLAQRDEEDKPVFPPGGTRVLAYPAAHFAVADGGAAGRAAGGSEDYGFMYLNLRMGGGRPTSVHQKTGAALLGVARDHVAAHFAHNYLGVTLQIDESPGQVFDGKHSNLHPLFKN
jgi:5-carboxymethyl-2-hydroxymuconate isomerase